MIAIALVSIKVAAALALFGALFFALFWTPGLLLGAFAVGFAADSRALSETLDRYVRRSQIVREARSFRGGWIDSTMTRTR